MIEGYSFTVELSQKGVFLVSNYERISACI